MAETFINKFHCHKIYMYVDKVLTGLDFYQLYVPSTKHFSQLHIYNLYFIR